MTRSSVKRHVLWLGLVCSFGLLFMMMGACNCDDTPASERLSEANQEKITKIDGGVVDQGSMDGNTSCTYRCDCAQGEECDVNTHVCIVPTVPVYCCDKENCPQGLSCVDSQGNTGSCDLKKTCKTNCDCDQGLACKEGFCIKDTNAVYCCEKAGCPAGETCISARGGTQTCGGEGFVCASTCNCIAGLACINGQCTKTSEPVYCCDNANCPKGKPCETSKGAKGICGNFKKCKNTCDCPAGEACSNGRCEAQAIPVYCCDHPKECPPKQVCDTMTGQRQQCPDKPECKQHCDCAQGQFCTKGQCVVGTSPVYCCVKKGCPAKSSCFKADGSIGVCPDAKCIKDSDCGKQTCRQQGTRCSQATPRCSADGVCRNEVSSTSGSCDPKSGHCKVVGQCVTHCDCPQGQRCTKGQCLTSSTPTYCCEKQGCPEGQACFNKNGMPGLCKKLQQCTQDVDCGSPKCKQVGKDCSALSPVCINARCSLTTRMVRSAICKGNKCLPTGPNQCKMHCDCPQGQGCINGKCLFAGGRVFYCCDKPGCPAKAVCYKKDNSKSYCPSSSKCNKDSDCGQPTCQQSGSMCIERIPRCDVTSGSCQGAGTSTQGTCNPKTGKCQALQRCQTTCDCPQGQGCIPSGPMPGMGGYCRPSPNTYCCTKQGCPPRAACFNPNGSKGTCPTACKSPCECATGEDCIKGKCIKGSTPMYCCDDTQKCPAGAQCKDKIGAIGRCPQQARPCKTVCDCVQGEACTNNKCVKSSNPTYCCDTPMCPAGKKCVNKFNQVGICPIPCKITCDCPQGERCYRGVCTKKYGIAYCCSKPGCPSNYSCYDKNNKWARCPITTCQSACDCTQGEDCRNGKCTRVNPPVYCCSSPHCPTGQVCKDKSGKWGKCTGTPTCKSLCDCPQGRDCYKGQCIQVYPAVYCCSKIGCPSGQACYDQNNKPSVCPGTQCTTSCDCQRQGQSCVRGRCIYANPRMFCCDKPGCQAGQTCEDKNGKLSVCPGQTCKSPCDCKQGQDCRGGVCTYVSPPVYCCSNSGCRAKQPCVNANGSSSTCPVECKVDCDCKQQGDRCSRGTCYHYGRSYCCDKPGCPAGQTCTDKNGTRKTCGSSGKKCKVRCNCKQGEECINNTCQRGKTPVYCCNNPGCPAGYICRDKNDKSGYCPNLPWP